MTEEAEVTTRGLIETDLGPLRKFTGVLDSMPTEKQTYGEGEKTRTTTRIFVNTKEIEVIEAAEPYHFPIYTIQVSLSNRKKSRWGVFSEGTPKDRTIGFNNVADQQYTAEQLDRDSAEYIKPVDRMDCKRDCIGKRLGFVLTDGEDGRPEPADLYDGRLDADKPTAAWTVYEIEGIGVAGGQGVSPMDLAMDMLDGKTLAEFNAKALANPIIRNDTPLLQAIGMPPTAPNSFANTMLVAKKFVQDEQGIFHKTEIPF